MKIDRLLDSAKEAALLAGHEIMKIYATDFEDGIEIKSDKRPLTAADKAANEVILKKLKCEFEQISILSEESETDITRFGNDWCWIIDPLDGTKEFIKRNGEFTVNIALVFKGKPVLGVIYVPVKDILYFAAEGMGAFKQTGAIAEKIGVTDKTDNLILVGSKSHASEKLRSLIRSKKDLISDIISAGSSLKGAMVAEGLADIYYRFGYTCEWDTAAMHAIVEQAGGIFLQMDGSEMTYNRTNCLNEKGFLAVNCSKNVWI